MATPPYKRRKKSQGCADAALVRLSGLLQAEVPLELQISAAGAVLAHGDITLAVPPALFARCSVIHAAPAGLLRDVVDLFTFWLEHEWRRALEQQAQQSPAAADASQDNVETIFELLKASDYLRDETGLEHYSQQAYALMMSVPLATKLPSLLRLHRKHLDLELHFRLLADLPADLKRRVLLLGPLPVLDRLPIGADLVRDVCDVHNEPTLQPQVERKSECWDSAPEELWEWRSAVAYHAGASVRVGASYGHWQKNIRDRYRGLQVFELYTCDASHAACDLPDGLVTLRLQGCVPTGGWQALRLPHTLRVLILDPPPPSSRVILGHLRLPAQLQRLEFCSRSVKLDGAVLPLHLTALMSRPPQTDQPLDLSAVQLPASLQCLHLHCIALQSCGCLQLPIGLTNLDLASTGLGPDAVRSLECLTALKRLNLSSLELDAGSLKGCRLPPSVTKLMCYGGGFASCGVELPAGLLNLRMLVACLEDAAALPVASLPRGLQHLDITQARIGSSGWLRNGPWPPSLTYICLDRALLSSDALKDVAWPPRLQILSINAASTGDRWRPVVLPCGLPGSLEHLELDGLSTVGSGASPRPALELRSTAQGAAAHASAAGSGVSLPPGLTCLGMNDVDFGVGDDALAGMRWPTRLQRLYLDGSNVGPHLHRAELPRAITMLALQEVDIRTPCSQLLRLPENVVELRLELASFGAGGLQSLVLPPRLKALALTGADLGPSGYDDVQLPSSLEVLHLQCRLLVGVGGSALPRAPWPSSLKKLLLYRIAPGKLKNVVCSELRGVEGLQSLEVVTCDDDDDDVDAGTWELLPERVLNWFGSARATPLSVCLTPEDDFAIDRTDEGGFLLD